MMHAIGTRGDVTRTAISPGYRNAIDGLRSFDDLSRALGRQRDAIVRDVTNAAAYPAPRYGTSRAGGSALGAAVAAYAGSEQGHAAIERALSAAGSWFSRLAQDGGPAQLPLPFG